MRFCSTCGQTVSLGIPADDNRERFICDACGVIHYQNPKNIVGTVPIWGQQLLLCRRAIEPRKSFWTLPAGFLELNETTSEGAQRETIEEAGAEVTMGSLYSIIHVPYIGQIHWFYLAQMKSSNFSPYTSESTEVKLFKESEIPWDDLAFQTVRSTLRLFFRDLKEQNIQYNHPLVPHIVNLPEPLKP